MSLAYKLYKIGECIDNNEFAQDLGQEIKNLDDCNFIVLNLYVSLKYKNRFKWEVSKKVKPIIKEKLFITKKIGGSGLGTIYLYPNVINKDKNKGLTQNIVSIKNSISKYTKKHKRVLFKLLQFLEKKEKDNILEKLSDFETNNKTIFLTLINGKTFYERYPEVLTIYASNPIKRVEKININGNSFFSDENRPIGFKPSINFFNVDNYYKPIEDEINEKIPFSEIDGANINKGWLFCDKNGFLKKDYERLKFYFLPSSNDKRLTKKIIDKIKNSKGLADFSDVTSKSFFEEIKMMVDWLVGNEQTNLVTFDFIFYEENNNQREIFGTIQDVMSSRIYEMYALMYDFKDFSIDDGFYKIGQRDKNSIYLMDYFCRDALWAKFNYKELDTSSRIPKYKRFLANERIFLASLLLGRQKINMDELLKRINKNINYEYSRKSGSNSVGEYLKMDNGIKNYLSFPKNMTLKHRILIEFLNKINAIKG